MEAINWWPLTGSKPMLTDEQIAEGWKEPRGAEKERAETVSIEAFPQIIPVGRLGAIAPKAWGAAGANAAAMDMIERRILRIEIALRRAGIEVESLDLPDAIEALAHKDAGNG